MVELGVSADNPALEHWLDTARELLESGYTKEDLDSLLTTVPEPTGVQERLPHFPDDDPDTVYTELPPGLIDLPSASKKLGIPVRTIRSWIKRGRLTVRGRLKSPSPGGGYLVVSNDELLTFASAPRDKGGRPPKPASYS